MSGCEQCVSFGCRSDRRSLWGLLREVVSTTHSRLQEEGLMPVGRTGNTATEARCNRRAMDTCNLAVTSLVVAACRDTVLLMHQENRGWCSIRVRLTFLSGERKYAAPATGRHARTAPPKALLLFSSAAFGGAVQLRRTYSIRCPPPPPPTHEHATSIESVGLPPTATFEFKAWRLTSITTND